MKPAVSEELNQFDQIYQASQKDERAEKALLDRAKTSERIRTESRSFHETDEREPIAVRGTKPSKGELSEHQTLRDDQLRQRNRRRK